MLFFIQGKGIKQYQAFSSGIKHILTALCRSKECVIIGDIRV
jgi:hypothetical protein